MDDLKKCEKEMTSYVDKIIGELYELRDRKIQEMRAEHDERDKYMIENAAALNALAAEIKNLVDQSPETLHGVLKQYKGTTGFIKTLTNGIIFPETNPVDVSIP